MTTTDIGQRLNRFQNRRFLGFLIAIVILPLMMLSDDRLNLQLPHWLIFATILVGVPIVIWLLLWPGSVVVSFDTDDAWRSAVSALANLRPKPEGKGSIKFRAKRKYLGIQGNSDFFVAVTPSAWFETRLIITPEVSAFRRAFIFAPGGWSTIKTTQLKATAGYRDVPTAHPWFSKEVVGQTWEHHTKSGDRDYRFKDNRQIALVRHYPVKLTASASPIWRFEFAHEPEQDAFIENFRLLTSGTKDAATGK